MTGIAGRVASGVACDTNSQQSGFQHTVSRAASPALRELAGSMPALATCASLVLLPLLFSHALSVHLNEIVLKMQHGRFGE